MTKRLILKTFTVAEGFRFDEESQEVEELRRMLTMGAIVLILPATGGWLIEYSMPQKGIAYPRRDGEEFMWTEHRAKPVSLLGTSDPIVDSMFSVLDSGFEVYLVPEENWSLLARFKLLHPTCESD